MLINRIGFQVFVAVVAFSCHAGTNNLESAILAFPDINPWNFRPDQAVQSANTFISAGQTAACAALEKAAKTERSFREHCEVDQKICHVCRLVFKPKNGGGILRAPMLGASDLLPFGSMKESDWPDMPFAIVNGVPLSMSSGYSLFGQAEKAEDYLAYCVSKGDFRTELFALPTSETASNALVKVSRSSAWKKLKWKDSGTGWSYVMHEDDAKSELWQQVKNMAEDPHPKKAKVSK